MCTHWVPREYESLTCVQPLSHFCLCVGKLWCGLMNTHAYAHRGRVRHASFWGLRMCVSFIMLELRSAGSYSTCQDWSPSPSQLLCFGPWRIQHLSWIFTGREREREQKKAACLRSIQRSHKMLQLQTLPVLKVFYSVLPRCRKQQKLITSVISDGVDVSLLQSRCLFERENMP